MNTSEMSLSKDAPRELRTLESCESFIMKPPLSTYTMMVVVTITIMSTIAV